MNQIVVAFFVFFCVSVFADQKKAICQLGQDPENPLRVIDWQKECIVKSAVMQQVKMSTGSGKIVDCTLPSLTPVVINKTTGVAEWILGCGNTIVEPNSWVPKGIKMCAPEMFLDKTEGEKQIQIPLVPSNIEGRFSHQVDVSGEIRHIHSGEIIMKKQKDQSTSVNISLPTISKKSNSWWDKNRKWVIPIAIIGGAAIGYASTKGGEKFNTVYYQPLPPPIKR